MGCPQELYDRLDCIGEELTPEENAIVNFYEIVGDFSMALVIYRVDHVLAQKELAKKLGISKWKLSRMEAGAYDISVEKMVNIATKLGFEVSVMFQKKKENKNVHNC
jgi:DNA-binding XRE family transcriptional regulator